MNRRGFIDPVTLAVVGGLAVGIFAGSWKPLSIFKKPPPTAQLSELQVKLDIATADAAKARADAAIAVAAERLRLEQQVRGGQRDNLGAAAAIKRVPKEHRTAEVLLAASMIDRTGFKLGAAIGKLPEEDAAQMVSLIDELLSNKQAEIDEANRKLAAMDADFKVVSAERESLKAQIPLLSAKVQSAENNATSVQVEVTTVTNQLKAKATELFNEQQAGGSFVGSLKKAAIIVGLGIAFVMFGIPAIVKHLESANPLKGLLRDANGYFLNPLTYHDAKKKLNDLNQRLSNPPIR